MSDTTQSDAPAAPEHDTANGAQPATSWAHPRDTQSAPTAASLVIDEAAGRRRDDIPEASPSIPQQASSSSVFEIRTLRLDALDLPPIFDRIAFSNLRERLFAGMPPETFPPIPTVAEKVASAATAADFLDPEEPAIDNVRAAILAAEAENEPDSEPESWWRSVSVADAPAAEASAPHRTEGVPAVPLLQMQLADDRKPRHRIAVLLGAVAASLVGATAVVLIGAALAGWLLSPGRGDGPSQVTSGSGRDGTGGGLVVVGAPGATASDVSISRHEVMRVETHLVLPAAVDSLTLSVPDPAATTAAEGYDPQVSDIEITVDGAAPMAVDDLGPGSTATVDLPATSTSIALTYRVAGVVVHTEPSPPERRAVLATPLAVAAGQDVLATVAVPNATNFGCWAPEATTSVACGQQTSDGWQVALTPDQEADLIIAQVNLPR